MFSVVFTRALHSSKSLANAKPARSIESLQTIVEAIAKRHFPDAESPLEVKLEDPVHKFKVLSDIMDAADRNISNVELNNIESVADALEVMTTAEMNVFKQRQERVEDILKTKDLPLNMHWIPSKRTLISQLEKQGKSVREEK